MIADFFLDFFAKTLNWLASFLPVSGGQYTGIPSFISEWVGRLFYYVDASPIFVALTLIAVCLAGFVIFKLVIWVWRLLPLT